MKPARSPWFQSAALRSSIAAISAWGFPVAIFEAEQATSAAAAAHHARRARPMASPFCSRRPQTYRGSALRRWLVPSERRSRGVTRGVLPTALLRRFLPLLTAPLCLRFRPTLRGLLLCLGSRRFPLLLCRHHHPGARPAALRKVGGLEHRVISPPLVVRARGLKL